MKKLILLFYLILLPALLSAQPGTWSEQNSGVTTNLNSVWRVNNFTALACGEFGTVLRTSNGGSNWINQTGNGIPLNVTLVSISGYGSVALVAGYSGTDTWVWKTTNSGLNWIQVFYQPGGFINSIWMNSATDCFMYGDPVGGRWSLWKSNDGGSNWDSTGLYLGQSGTETGYNNAMVIQSSRIWFGTNNSRIYYSSNYGINWTSLSTSPEVDSYTIWFHPMVSTGQGLFGGENLYKTTNNGTNWSSLPTVSTGQFSGITSLPLLVDKLLVQPVWYIRNLNLIYYSSNYGTNWSIDYTNPSGVVTYKHMSMAYWGSGIWVVGTLGKISYHSPLVGIIKSDSKIPSSFSLFQNYPNPFNPTTMIKFAVLKTGFVKVVVFDVIGKEVRTLVNEKLQPGTYETTYDGSTLNSGMYFCKMSVSQAGTTAEVFSETKKMLMVK